MIIGMIKEETPTPIKMANSKKGLACSLGMLKRPATRALNPLLRIHIAPMNMDTCRPETEEPVPKLTTTVAENGMKKIVNI
jgi:hypothetical protein